MKEKSGYKYFQRNFRMAHVYLNFAGCSICSDYVWTADRSQRTFYGTDTATWRQSDRKTRSVLSFQGT